jgi:hypothetical protein
LHIANAIPVIWGLGNRHFVRRFRGLRHGLPVDPTLILYSLIGLCAAGDDGKDRRRIEAMRQQIPQEAGPAGLA